MNEPDVTLTDYCLAIECALFVFLLYQKARKAPLRFWFILFFASTGLAALVGGTVHGFFLDPGAVGYHILWQITLIAIGLTAMATWTIAARLWFTPPVARQVSVLAAVEFALYVGLVLVFTTNFSVAVLNYMPPAIFLLIVFSALYADMQTPQLLAGVIGVALTFMAAAVLAAGIALHPVYFNHNALYHAIQAFALLMIFRTAYWLAKEYPTRGGPYVDSSRIF
jgi:hypothetical protein